MKKLFLLFSCLFAIGMASAQDGKSFNPGRSSGPDFVVKSGNDTIWCKILDVNDDVVQYQVRKNGLRETNTIARKYVVDYKIDDEASDLALPETEVKEKNSSFRLAFAAGYAYRAGKVIQTRNADLDQLSNDLRHGYALDAEIQYYFNQKYGISLNLNYVNSNGEVKEVHIPTFGNIPGYKETQHILFVGPAFTTRHDTKQWLFTGSIGLGPLFFVDVMESKSSRLHGTSPTFGINYGIGAEYKLSSCWAAGLKLSATNGSTKSLTITGVKSEFDEVFNLSSYMISAYFSFRTK